MIIKDRDSRKKDIEELYKLLNYQNITSMQRFFIERELNSIKKGELAEDDSVYYINFYFGKSDNWIVVHDLRIEINGRVAQIDHLLVSKFFDIYVLESKSYKYGIRITENGDFEVYYNRQYIGIPSPIEQNRRHIAVLSDLIKYYDLMPKRLSVSIRPRFLNYVLIHPKALIKRPNAKRFDTSNVIKADTLRRVIDNNTDKIDSVSAISLMLKISSVSSLVDFGKELIRFHKPASIDWKKRFGISEEQQSLNKIRNQREYFCARCKAKVSLAEARFCWNNKKRFKGRVYCYKCQKEFVK